MRPNLPNIPLYLAHWGRERPMAVAIEVLRPRGKMLSYQQVCQEVAVLTMRLRRLGVKPGDCVPIFGKLDEQLFVAMLAIASLGASSLPISMISPASRNVLDVCGRERGFRIACGTQHFASFIKSVKPIAKSFEIVHLEESGEFDGSAEACVEEWEALIATVPATSGLYLNHTSGSTASPKIVEATHSQIIANGDACLRFFDAFNDGRVPRRLCGFVYHHHEHVARSLIEGGCAILLPRHPAGEDLAELCLKHRVTHLLINPHAGESLAALPDAVLQKLRQQLNQIEIGGGAVPDRVANRICLAARAVFCVYGSTETTGVCLAKRLNGRADSEYIPIPGYTASIESELDGAGELVISGTAVGGGYLGNPPGQIALLPDGFHTKDLALRKADGSIQILGRYDDVIKGIAGRQPLIPIEQLLADAIGPDALAVQILDIEAVGIARALGLNSSLLAVVQFRQADSFSDAQRAQLVRAAVRQARLVPLVTAPQRIVIARPNELGWTDTGKLRRSVARRFFPFSLAEWPQEQNRRLISVPIGPTGIIRTLQYLAREVGSVVGLRRIGSSIVRLAVRRIPFASGLLTKPPALQKMAVRTAAVLLILYLIMLGLLCLFEDRLVYHPGSGRSQGGNPAVDMADVEEAWIPTSGGLRLHALICSAPKRGLDASGRVVLYLHGNRGTTLRRLPLAAEWHAALDARWFVAVDYRGYGLSEGTPSEAGFYEDAHATWRWLVDDRGVQPEHIVVVGRSIGGAVAVELATTHKVGGLVIESTFARMPEVAQEVLPCVPCDLLMRNRYPTIDRIGSYRGPLIIAHGRQDELISPEHGRRLFQAANEPKCFIEVPTSRHMEFPTKDYYTAVREFFESHQLDR